jgi:uncharacterized membrane protein required for colicin V production
VNGLAWPDIVLGIVAIVGTLKGFKRGLVEELTGAVALAFAIGAAFAYGGTWDAWVGARTHLGPGSTHVVGMVLYAAVAYVVVFAIGMALSTVAKLPIVGTANALGGAVVGLVKATVLAWAVVYVALFFPLSRDLRDDLHHSRLVAVLETPNAHLDGILRGSLPWFVKPFAASMFARHRV